MRWNRVLDAVHVASAGFVAVSLGPALAHLLELPNKMGLPRADYLTVQQIYRGWALLGIVVVGALLATLLLVVLLRREGPAFAWSLATLLCIVGAQVVFWLFTYPANVATANWTVLPNDWQPLRARWEYSHAGGAAFMLAAMASSLLCFVARIRRARRSA
ncbi:MAG: hypothetical protein KIT16_19960 [Rhodospirillaceae bacterium]|nr:hypothetical protein [Rhodospirillaceae bacterium]